MSKLTPEPPRLFRPTLAAWIGLNESIFLEQLNFILTEVENKGRFADGKKWYRDTPRAFMIQYFPFWDESIVKRTIANLRADALIQVRSDLNEDHRDRSLWYTINYPALERLDGPVARITGKSDKRKEARKARKPKPGSYPDYTKVQNVPLSDEAGTNSTSDNQQNVLLPQVQNVPTPKESLIPKETKTKERIPPKGVDKSTKPKQVSENQQESRAMFSALARLCGYDLDLLTEDIRGALNQAERLMRDRGYKPADVDAFGEWWYLHDWRGKQNQAPDLSLIRKTWGQFRKSQKEDKLAAPPDLSPAPDLPECESTWERAGRILRGNRMTSDTFDSLLRDAQPIPHENGTFTLAVRSSAKVWIENRNLKPVILAALKEVKPEIHGLDFEELAQ